MQGFLLGSLTLICLWLCSLTGAQAVNLHHGLSHTLSRRKFKTPSVKVQGIEIIGRDWSGTDLGEVVTFFDVRYSPGACPNCTLPRYAFSNSSRWNEGLTSPILANSSMPAKYCMQRPNFFLGMMESAVEITEDCLHLDIYAPRKAVYKKGSKRNVLVFIHGGGGLSMGKSLNAFFDFAAKGYQGLSKKDRPIVVSINYRLGSFGMLRHPDLEANKWHLGLLDCVEALKWVQNNIASFGGDASKVTIMGESFGGATVGLLSRMPSAKGLFKSGIPISGLGFGRLSLSPSDEICKSYGVAEFNDAIGNNTIFDASSEVLFNAPYPTPYTGAQYNRFCSGDVIPFTEGWDNGRSDDDVPLLVLGTDQEDRNLNDGYLVKESDNTIDNARAWLDGKIKDYPLFQKCLQSQLEKIELGHGTDPIVALFRAYNIVYFWRGGPQHLLRNRPNVFTGTWVDIAYKTFIDDPSRPDSMYAHHSMELMGSLLDIAPWMTAFWGRSPQTLVTELPILMVPFTEITSQKQAIEVGFINRAVHFMSRKAVIDFMLDGTPGWRHDQHANFQPTSNKKPILGPAMDEFVNITQAFYSKCASECILPPFTGAKPSDDVCKSIIENVDCIC